MPPNIKVTKENIINTAMEIVREQGADALNARTIAAKLGCSTQPVFSNFANMDALRFAVAVKASCLYKDYMSKEIASGNYPIYKASGMAYIRFAKEEKELFKLLYMCDRSDGTIGDDQELTDKMTTIIKNNTGLSEQDAKLFHLEIWASVHGIATMFATGFLDLDWELVSKMLTDIYQGLRTRYQTEEQYGCYQN